VPVAVNDIADRLSAIAASLREHDCRYADWFTESLALVRLGVTFEAAFGLSHGFTAVLRQSAQDQALLALAAGHAGLAINARASEIQRQLKKKEPDGPAGNYLRAGGPTGHRSLRRRLTELAKITDDLANGSRV
jgi:hypothetical protein